MKCMNCGATLNKSEYCPSCGFHVEVQKKVWQLSNMYYNLGLDKAEIRDLSGAIDMLRRSLKFNKLNIQARNLLGLVYFETGEAVAALSEWIISKNIMPENNIASEYIDRLQENANKLDVINQTIKKYNECLHCCRNGSEDVAVIQLRKILNQNPKLIKGYHLLALIYIKNEEYEKARRILKKAARIDKTNSTTLRFLKEVDSQTGTKTNLESRYWPFGSSREVQEKTEYGQSIAYVSDNDLVIQPPAFRETSMAVTLLNLAFGFLVGALLVWFLLVPANTQKVNREANEKVVNYSNTMASQSAEMDKLQEQIEESEKTVSSAQEQIEEANSQVTTYENLIKAYAAYQAGNLSSAASVMENVDSDLLSVDAKEIYDTIYAGMQSTLLATYKKEGNLAFYSQDYATAIESLTKALEMDDTDYEVLNLLAHSYRLSGDFDKAKEVFQQIVDTFPGSKRASNAQVYVDNDGHGYDDYEADLPDNSGVSGSGNGTAGRTTRATGAEDDTDDSLDDTADEDTDDDNIDDGADDGADDDTEDGTGEGA